MAIKTFTNITETWFSLIEIEKYNSFGKKRFVANFKYGYSESTMKDHQEFGFNVEELLEDVSYCIGGEIDERHYIIK